MQQQKFNIKLLGIVVIICAAAHFFLNLYIIILPHFFEPEKVQSVMRILSQKFGPIAIQQNRNLVILTIKVITSALFLISGIGAIGLKEWSRKLLFFLLGARIIYGLTICIIFRRFYPHFAIILVVGAFFFYYLSRQAVKRAFI